MTHRDYLGMFILPRPANGVIRKLFIGMHLRGLDSRRGSWHVFCIKGLCKEELATKEEMP